MKIAVPIQFVPDLVEELVVDASGIALDPASIRWTLNEFDDHAIEQAVLLKENSGAEVTVIAPDFEGADDTLYNAAARGVDHIIRLYGDFENGLNNHALARILVPVLQNQAFDLILTGVQAHNSLDGPLGPMLAEMLGLVYVGYVSKIDLVSGLARVNKEYPGGLIAQMDVQLPAVIGIQAAETPPRYVPIAKIRQAMKTSQIDEAEAATPDPAGALTVEKMFPPEPSQRATMIEGSIDEIAERIASILMGKAGGAR